MLQALEYNHQPHMVLKQYYWLFHIEICGIRLSCVDISIKLPHDEAPWPSHECCTPVQMAIMSHELLLIVQQAI